MVEALVSADRLQAFLGLQEVMSTSNSTAMHLVGARSSSLGGTQLLMCGSTLHAYAGILRKALACESAGAAA